MPDHQNDARRRLLVALALERSRSPAPVDGVLRRALEGDERAARRLGGRGGPGDRDQWPESRPPTGR